MADLASPLVLNYIQSVLIQGTRVDTAMAGLLESTHQLRDFSNIVFIGHSESKAFFVKAERDNPAVYTQNTLVQVRSSLYRLICSSH